MAPNLSDEQNRILKGVYKLGRKIAHCESHIRFLKQSLESGIIPKRFLVKNTLPGCKIEIQKQLDLASFTSIKTEKMKHENTLKNLLLENENLKEDLKAKFSPEASEKDRGW